MSLREIIYSVREDFQLMSDDNDVTNEYIAYLIRTARNTVLQQRYSDPRNIVPSASYQSVIIPIGTNAKSSINLPTIIKTTGNAHAPVKVYGVGVADTNLEVPVNVVNLERLPYVGKNQFTADLIYCAINEDGTIIFNSDNNLYKLIDTVAVRGIFENPESAYNLTGNAVDFYDTRYPLAESDLLDVRKIVDRELERKLGVTKDNLNDSTEERLDKNPQGNQ
jgi:hypothetical protein